MIRFDNLRAGVWVALVTAVVLAGCAKSSEEERKVELLDGNANEATFLAGVSARPTKEAKEHCSIYGKMAVLRDVEPAGSVFESFTTGSRPYLYYFDCL